MTVLATYRFNHDDEAHYTPSADMEPGEIAVLPDGRAAINNSNNVIKADTKGRVSTKGLVETTIGAAMVFADGADVHLDAGAIATTGGVVIGKARRGGSPNGSTTLIFSLNAHS